MIQPSRTRDTGLVEVDLLAHQARAGFDAGGQTPYVGLWANVPADDFNLLRLVTARMGCGYLGVNLAQADQQAAAFGTPTRRLRKAIQRREAGAGTRCCALRMTDSRTTRSGNSQPGGIVSVRRRVGSSRDWSRPMPCIHPQMLGARRAESRWLGSRQARGRRQQLWERSRDEHLGPGHFGAHAVGRSARGGRAAAWKPSRASSSIGRATRAGGDMTSDRSAWREIPVQLLAAQARRRAEPAARRHRADPSFKLARLIAAAALAGQLDRPDLRRRYLRQLARFLTRLGPRPDPLRGHRAAQLLPS